MDKKDFRSFEAILDSFKLSFDANMAHITRLVSFSNIWGWSENDHPPENGMRNVLRVGSKVKILFGNYCIIFINR